MSYQTEYYQRNKDEIRLRRIAKRRALTVRESCQLAFHQVERVLNKADPEASRLVALNFMRTGYSQGNRTQEEAAAQIVAERFGLEPETIHLWYAEVLEREKLEVRAELRGRGV